MGWGTDSRASFGKGSPSALFSSCPLSSPLPCPPSPPPSLLHSAFASQAVSSEAQTIEADDPTAESTASPPPAARNRLLHIAGAQAARLRLFPPSHFFLEMSPHLPPTPLHPSGLPPGGSRASLWLHPFAGTPMQWGGRQGQAGAHCF